MPPANNWPWAAERFLVENGQPRAEIVIAEVPTRTQRLAAHEFRAVIDRISGARLPIVTRPTGRAAKVFIGESASCPVKVDGLSDGAYRSSFAHPATGLLYHHRLDGPKGIAILSTPEEIAAQMGDDILNRLPAKGSTCWRGRK